MYAIVSNTLKIMLTLWVLSSCAPQLYHQHGSNDTAQTSHIPYRYEHRLVPGDQLSLSVWDHPDLSVGSAYEATSLDPQRGKQLEIGPNGFVVMPMIGKVKLGGKTLKEAEDILTKLYGHYIESPHLSLRAINLEVTITGEVNSPGVYTVERQSIALPKLLGRSGGITKYANTSEIQIFRGDPNDPAIILVDLSTMAGLTNSEILVYPEDIIHIPAKKGKKLDMITQRFVPVIGLLSAIALIISVTN